MTMIDLLTSVFASLSYEDSPIEFEEWSGIVFIPYPGSVVETFFIAIERDGVTEADLKDLAERLHLLQQCIKALPSYRAQFDKNMSLIICYPSETNGSNEFTRQLEEDPYHFKKTVLRYDTEALKELKQFLNGDFSLDKLNELVMDGELFKSLKRKAPKSSGYELLTRLFIKIPVISFQHEASTDLTALSVTIHESLLEKGVDALRDQALQIENVDDVTMETLGPLLQRATEDEV